MSTPGEPKGSLLSANMEYIFNKMREFEKQVDITTGRLLRMCSMNSDHIRTMEMSLTKLEREVKRLAKQEKGRESS